MEISSIMSHGVTLFVDLLHLVDGSARRNEQADSETQHRVLLDRAPDSTSLAGVPLRILLSDRSGPGGLLRDTLLTRPSSHYR